jgi:hypothetical protein
MVFKIRFVDILLFITLMLFYLSIFFKSKCYFKLHFVFLTVLDYDCFVLNQLHIIFLSETGTENIIATVC